jgi:hypothetical protein
MRKPCLSCGGKKGILRMTKTQIEQQKLRERQQTRMAALRVAEHTHAMKDDKIKPIKVKIEKLKDEVQTIRLRLQEKQQELNKLGKDMLDMLEQYIPEDLRD